LQVVTDLIGKVLLHKTKLGEIAVIINETEAYSQDEPASHAARGLTPRTEALFKEGGCVYTYLSYGIHSCMNFVTEHKG
jgi:DNA-3-methyladenine glycosylase